MIETERKLDKIWENNTKINELFKKCKDNLKYKKNGTTYDFFDREGYYYTNVEICKIKRI